MSVVRTWILDNFINQFIGGFSLIVFASHLMWLVATKFQSFSQYMGKKIAKGMR